MIQLPAVNTPQFEVVWNRLGAHAQPVPPVYQPETAGASSCGSGCTGARSLPRRSRRVSPWRLAAPPLGEGGVRRAGDRSDNMSGPSFLEPSK